jgi:signal transduction histidine kinase
MVAVLLISALVPHRLPETAFHHRFFDTGLLLCDTVLLCMAIFLNRDVPWDLYLLYFFVVFLAAMGESMAKVALGSIIICLVYIALLLQQGRGLTELSGVMFIRIPFLFGVSILYGFLAENAKRERRRVAMVEERESLRMDLVTALAHDIQSPLGIIMGYASLMEETDGQGKERGEAKVWARIQECARRIADLVTGFIEAGKAEKGKLKMKMRPVQVNQLLREAARQLEPDIQRKELKLKLELDKRLPDVLGDDAQLERVFWNLIGNAIKFTRNRDEITVSSRRDNGCVCVDIQDTGIGIPEEDLQLVFSQFRRSKGTREIEGSGLGLFIARTIVEAHKGTVRAKSGEGKGSTFTVHLPIGS